ncbi:hypothetical protein EV363DRAFT_1493872 [Boletus edulis]|uniref:Uncharacterized protein n=1 Tax=Boletus edulis BED1 TaxID=1328754 RepID=A0AAD4BN11_BOLED|nr:hypothetical protein EV363DRAFT_1493872 [Boletus edulis]KAF8435339.1 hypothetical protein L210DRAFT_3452958 [Boletus edulis BED1]
MSSLYDLVGPVLPQALRLARYQASATLPQNVDDIQSENDTVNKTPSREEERLLLSNASVMTALEDLFSWSEKDRTCRTSKLSRVESVRFQRAMYRIWLMSVLFGPRRFAPQPADEIRESELRKSWKDQKYFLQPFSSQELFQIDRLTKFLIWTAQWAVTAEEIGLKGTPSRGLYNYTGLFLFAGPHAILRCYEDVTTTHLPAEYIGDDGPYTKLIDQALSEIVQERQVTVPYGYQHVGFILDDIHGEHDRCRHCGSNGAPCIRMSWEGKLPDLYNETNWDHLKGRLNRDFFLPMNLSLNLVERQPTQALSGDWSRLLHEMFACRRDDYIQWSKEDWICINCWFTFFRDTMWRWRLFQKNKAGEHIEEDCRYGYNCKEQCHESGLAHARQFNVGRSFIV